MGKRMRWFSMMAVLTVLAGGLTFPAAGIASQSNLEVQCVVDQKTAVADGHVSVHILYHNVSNKNMEKAWLKVKVHGKAEVDEAAGAEWDNASGSVRWQLKDVAAGGAGVVHLDLKVKQTVAIGEEIRLECEADDDDGVISKTPSVPVRVGTELHQPAFDGYPDGGFHPNGLLTRAETAAIVSRLELLPAAPAANYKDVPAGHWAASYIAKVTKAGWMTGADGAFRPDAPISRGEFAVLLLRMRGITALPLSGFRDTGKHWAKDAVGTGKELGYFSGNDKDDFDADGALRRDEAAKMLALALSRGELVDGQTKVVQHWPDVPRSAWSFGWVEELSLLAHEAREKGAMKEELVRYAPENTLPF